MKEVSVEKMVSVPAKVEQAEQFKEVNAKPKAGSSIVLKGGIGTLDIARLSAKDVERYLLAHPIVPRGIEIRANRMTGRGYTLKPFSDSPKAKEAYERMKKLLENSGGEILINGWIKDTYGFGNGYLTLLEDKETKEIVYLSREHPMFFRIARNEKEKNSRLTINDMHISGDFTDKYGFMKINDVTKKPLAYTQVIYSKDNPNKVEPTGQEIPASRVAHLVFDTWGDEAEGIGYVQYVHLLLKYLMNIEEASAESIYRSGFTQKKVTTNIKTEQELVNLGRNLSNINTSDAIILPEGTDVNNLVPGQSEFVSTHETFTNLIAIRLGVPKPILTLDGSDINKATMQELMRDLTYDIRAEELKVCNAIREQIFVPACETMFGTEFEEVPYFEFNDFNEGKEEVATVIQITSDYVTKFTNAYKTLKELGADAEAQTILDYMIKNIPVQSQLRNTENTSPDKTD